MENEKELQKRNLWVLFSPSEVDPPEPPVGLEGHTVRALTQGQPSNILGTQMTLKERKKRKEERKKRRKKKIISTEIWGK